VKKWFQSLFFSNAALYRYILDQRDLARLFQRLVPDVSNHEIRGTLAHLAASDGGSGGSGGGAAGLGKVSFSELRQVLRAVKVVQPAGTGAGAGTTPTPTYGGSPTAAAAAGAYGRRAGGASASAAAPVPVPSYSAVQAPDTPRRKEMMNHADMEVWELHEERLGGSLYLVDRETSVAYHPPRTQDEWPRLGCTSRPIALMQAPGFNP
jgi:hypothetical protein